MLHNAARQIRSCLRFLPEEEKLLDRNFENEYERSGALLLLTNIEGYDN